MAEKDENPKGENENPEGEEDEKETDDDSEEEDDDSDDDEKDDSGKNPELVKAIKARDRAKAEARRLKAELAKKGDDDKPKEPSAEEKANARLIRTAAHGVLRGMGVEDKSDRAEILDMLNLSDVAVDDDGADEDEIEEKIELLRRVFAPKNGTPGRNVPKSTRKNAGTKETTTDPDKARYQRLLGRG